jgi:hypothetical protein
MGTGVDVIGESGHYNTTITAFNVIAIYTINVNAINVIGESGQPGAGARWLLLIYLHLI